VLLAQKRFTEAFKSDYDGREFARKNLDVCGFYIFTQQLGLVKFKQEQYLKAIPYFKQALAESRACIGNRTATDLLYFPQGVLTSIALSFENAGKLDSAVVYYKRTITFLDENKVTFPASREFIELAKGVVYGNLGGVYAKIKNDAEAEKYLKESIRINDRPNRDRNDAKTAKVKLAALYIANNRIAEADELLNQLQNNVDNETNTSANKSIRVNLYKLKWSLFDKTNQTAQAYKYLVKYKALNDSVNEVKNGLKSVDMDVAFAANQQQNKLALLGRSNDVKNAYIIAIAVFCLMALGILSTVWFNFKRYRKVVKQVTEQNIQMQAALSALEQSQEDNTRMMKVVAHDLRNPIGGITSLAAQMLDDDDRTEDDRTMLELIKTSGQDSLDMVSDLLQVNSRSETLKKESVDISNMLHYCVEQLKHKAKAKGQNIELQTKHAIIPVNREKLWRVISNLIGNAIKFSPTGGTIVLKLTEYPGKAVIAVQDYGIGIPDNMKEKIFNMFPEAQRAGTGGEQSFGLGLAISKQIVEAHEGKLWFESVTGKGTTFFVELPTAGTT
jgi:signal transduction histidine kinase